MWDEIFKQKLYLFFSLEEDRIIRRSGRSTVMAETLLRVAVQSRKEVRYDIDHYVDKRAKVLSSDEMIRLIHDIAVKWRKENIVDIRLEIDRRGRTFKAYKNGSGFIPAYKQTSVFPIQRLKERKEYLNKQLLLLL